MALESQGYVERSFRKGIFHRLDHIGQIFQRVVFLSGCCAGDSMQQGYPR